MEAFGDAACGLQLDPVSDIRQCHFKCWQLEKMPVGASCGVWPNSEHNEQDVQREEEPPRSKETACIFHLIVHMRPAATAAPLAALP